jgi:hypothetical protein
MGNVQSVDADSLFAGEGEHTTRDFCRKLAARLRYKWTTSLDEWCDDVAVDTHTIPVPKAIAKVKRFVDMPSFRPDEVKKVSGAACALCIWVHAIYLYANVAKEVAPSKWRV